MSGTSGLPPMKPMEELPPVREQAPRDLPNINDPAVVMYLPKWHWGAFVFQWVWAAGHNMPGVTALALLGWMFTGGLISGIVMGLLGYRLAWESRGYRDYLQLRNRERVWNIAAFIALAILGLLFLVGLIVYAHAARSVPRGV